MDIFWVQKLDCVYAYGYKVVIVKLSNSLTSPQVIVSCPLQIYLIISDFYSVFFRNDIWVMNKFKTSTYVIVSHVIRPVWRSR
jgi:hypothetical protein